MASRHESILKRGSGPVCIYCMHAMKGTPGFVHWRRLVNCDWQAAGLQKTVYDLATERNGRQTLQICFCFFKSDNPRLVSTVQRIELKHQWRFRAYKYSHAKFSMLLVPFSHATKSIFEPINDNPAAVSHLFWSHLRERKRNIKSINHHFFFFFFLQSGTSSSCLVPTLRLTTLLFP